MGKKDIIAAIDIGSSKVVALIAIVEDGGINIVGIGQHPSNGVSKGQIINIDKTTNDIQEAMNSATLMAGVKFTRLYVGIGGGHIETITSKGMVAIQRGNIPITKEDVGRVIEQAKAIAIPTDREISHIIPQEFKVNEEIETNDPIGMTGIRLEGNIKIITSSSYSVQNIKRCVEKAHLKNAIYVVNPIASAYATFDENEKKMGAIMLDIGAETTSIVIYEKGNLRYVGVVEIGGEFITKDIVYGLNTTRENAENFKINYGCARLDMVDDNEIIEVPGVSGRAPRKISKQEFIQIIEPRTREILELAYAKIIKESDVPIDRIGAGLILTGGTANLPGISELGEDIFNLRGRIGNPMGVSGIGENIYDPAFSTSVGLIKYAVTEEGTSESSRGMSRPQEGWIKKIFDWLKDI